MKSLDEKSHSTLQYIRKVFLSLEITVKEFLFVVLYSAALLIGGYGLGLSRCGKSCVPCKVVCPCSKKPCCPDCPPCLPPGELPK